jgi:chemotaxis protein methyltransferase CheR
MFEEDIIPLPADVFRLIRDFLNEYCGIYFDDNAKYKLEHRLNRRLKIHHLKNFREYYRLLKYSEKCSDELKQILDILTVNETYFFREQNQLQAFRDEILPQLQNKNKDKKTINIWSAGCSTGEEPYTIAMLILEKGGFNDWDINIFASDISQRVLRVGREGVYQKNSFRTMSMYFMKKYFHAQPNGSFKISDGVKKFVNFSNLNLVDSLKLKLMGKMDVIFCRNVLIYFNRNARKKLIENFGHILVEGGYLLLGHSESIINLSTDFTIQYLRNDIVYQRPIRKPEVTVTK